MEDTGVKNTVKMYLVVYRTYICLAVRVASLASCCTFYVPDEYWQSTEVAHHQVYGYGYLTWEWAEKIRPYLHPFFFELYFRCLKLVSLDFTVLLLYGPHVMQAVLSVFADRAVYNLALDLFGLEDVAVKALLLHLCSWFVFYTSARTLSNTAEMCFLVIGLSYFKSGVRRTLKSNHRDAYSSCSDPALRRYWGLLFGGIGCVIRPTSLIIWGPLILIMLLLKEVKFCDLFTSVLKTLPLMLLLSFGVDYYFYNQFVFVHYNFFKFNLVLNVSSFYGTHSFSWYFAQGIPVVFSLHLIYVMYAVSRAKMRELDLAVVALVYILVHSCIPHKEFRFLLPVCPIFACYAGYGLHYMAYDKEKIYSKFTNTSILVILPLNLFLALYFSLVHQRGTVAVLSYLRNKQLSRNHSVLFLMPCHSTPFYSHLLENIDLKFLTCQPNLNQSASYRDEADKFYDDPRAWMISTFPPGTRSPSHIVLFDVLADTLKEVITQMNYVKEYSLFHTHLPEGRVGQNVYVYVKT